LVLFLKRTRRPKRDLLGARPQTPRVGFAEIWASELKPRGANVFGSFFKKEKTLPGRLRGLEIIAIRFLITWKKFEKVRGDCVSGDEAFVSRRSRDDQIGADRQDDKIHILVTATTDFYFSTNWPLLVVCQADSAIEGHRSEVVGPTRTFKKILAPPDPLNLLQGTIHSTN
jgi:hypothetical protein